MEWLAEHWEIISTITGILLAIASVITGLTDTPLDNTVVDVIKKIFGQISFTKHADAEGTLKLPGTSAGPIMSERTVMKEAKDPSKLDLDKDDLDPPFQNL